MNLASRIAWHVPSIRDLFFFPFPHLGVDVPHIEVGSEGVAIVKRPLISDVCVLLHLEQGSRGGGLRGGPVSRLTLSSAFPATVLRSGR